MRKNYEFWVQRHPILKKLIRYFKISILVCVLSIVNVFAVSTIDDQQIRVTGTITDASTGEAMVGVNIQVRGTTFGAISDAAGKYSLSVPDRESILVFSFIGYVTREIPLNGRTTVDVALSSEVRGLEEVVVVGYGTQKRVNLTGAVDVIKSEKLVNRQAATVSQLLQGLTPSANFTISGMEGVQPGAEMNITLRGIGSLSGGTPYILINGVPGNINNLNPDDIESISVLKDAASAAIYGAKAAYGVILVTTKKGKTDEKMNVTYTGTVSLSTPPPLPGRLDSYTWAKVTNEAGDNMGGRPLDETHINNIIAYQNEDWEFLRKTFAPGQTVFGAVAVGNFWHPDLGYTNNDWWDIMFDHGINQKHDLFLQGGTKNVSYYFSAGYLGQEGYMTFGNDRFDRTNIIGSIQIAVAPWLDFSWEPRLAHKVRLQPTYNANYANTFSEISRMYPWTPLYDGWGKYWQWCLVDKFTKGGSITKDEIDAWNDFKIEMRPLKGWKINVDFAYNNNQGFYTTVRKTVMNHMVDNTYEADPQSVPNYIQETHSNSRYWTTNIYSSYNLDISNIHHFSILAGSQFEAGKYSELTARKNDMIVQDVPSITTATGILTVGEDLSHRAVQGYFGRFNYNYKEKYLFESNVRYDGSYVFRQGNRWGFFPSFSLGWNVNKETFWQSIEKYINTLKLRASWGQLGNQNISPYTDLELLPLQSGSLNWIFGYGSARPIGYTGTPSLVNKNLTWETATTGNIGLNMSFLNNRLTFDVDLFQRTTTDMVGPQPALPGVLGASAPQANNATLRTRGWEVTGAWRQSFEGGFSYSIEANLSDYSSIVTKYYNPTGTLSTWYEGREVGEIWGFKVNDLFRTQQELDAYKASVDMTKIASVWKTGDIKIEDINNDKIIDRGKNTVDDHGDQMIIGNSEPHYLFGITLGAGFKGFDFSMLWRGVVKKDIFFDRTSNIFWGNCNGWWTSCLQPRTLDYFRDVAGTKYSGPYEGDANINTDAYFPRPYLNTTQETKNKNNPTTRYLQNGAYARLSNIQLGYSLPSRFVSKLKLQKVRIALSGKILSR